MPSDPDVPPSAEGGPKAPQLLPKPAPAVAKVTSAVYGAIESATESVEERLERVLAALKKDYDENGIVVVELDYSKSIDKDYEAALQQNRTAGIPWGGEGGMEARLREYLLVNDAAKLKLAEAMPGGPFLVGVWPDGTPAIRQRSSEIMNVRWEKDWPDSKLFQLAHNQYNSPEITGKPLLLPHAEALQLDSGTWANPHEMVQAAETAGYRIRFAYQRADRDHPTPQMPGPVAAYEAVSRGRYVDAVECTEGKIGVAVLAAPGENFTHMSFSRGVNVVCFWPTIDLSHLPNDDPANTHIAQVLNNERKVYIGLILWL
ncbi:hypothetical protein IPG41_04320 [Candidatus Peregrinibacteria bacterium]|nr:MAG: hypothetical protein IPG41_04320 [Candidatus Peregrinibacteria bacterium]